VQLTGQDARDEVRCRFSREASIEREHANLFDAQRPESLESLVERADQPWRVFGARTRAG